MKRNPRTLDSTTFDVLVIGGGITGAFAAWDAATRGLRTALIEKADFGAATSAASSKLLHGGIRYLQQAQLHKVRESAMERAHLQYMAPHHSHFIPFLVPSYRSLAKSRLALEVALRAYAVLCAGERGIIRDRAKYPPPFQTLSRAETLQAAPWLDAPRLTGAVVLPESHMHSSERMTLSVVRSAVAAGATACNYVKATGLLRRGNRIEGASAADVLTGDTLDIRARVTINAAGPWIPTLPASSAIRAPTTGYARGAHLVLEGMPLRHALALPTRKAAQSVLDRGGRHVFLIPWRNRTLLGTSYAGYAGDLDALRVEESDVSELLDAVNDAAPGLQLDRGHVRHAFCGLYPLQASDIRTGVYQGTGEYAVIDHGRTDKTPGLVTALGAKYTTARRVGEMAVDVTQRQLGTTATSSGTTGRRCDGGDIDDIAALEREVAGATGDAAIATHLVQAHGTHARSIARRIAAGDRAILSPNQPVTLAEIDHVLEHEMACRLDDVVFRRTGLGTVGHPGEECLQSLAQRMAERLGWPASRLHAELEEVRGRFGFPGTP